MTTTAAEWHALAQAALDRRDGDEILRCTAEALALDPGHAGAKALRLMVYRQVIPALEARGRWERLLEVGRELHARDLDPALGYLIEAGALLELGRLEECRRAASTLAADHPDEAHAYYLRGTANLREASWSAAIPDLERALWLDPEHGDALINLGMCQDKLGRSAEALVLYDRVLGLAPDAPHLHGNRATSLSKLGRHDEALAALERAIALAPADGALRLRRAQLLARTGRSEAALEAVLELSGTSRDDYLALTAEGLVPSIEEPDTVHVLCALLTAERERRAPRQA